MRRRCAERPSPPYGNTRATMRRISEDSKQSVITLSDADLAASPPFSYLGLNIQEMFLTGEAQYPVERTLLVTVRIAGVWAAVFKDSKRHPCGQGALDALMRSRHLNERVVTPHLTEIQFAAPSGELLARPRNPRATGASVQASAEWLRDYPVEGGGSQLRGFFGQVSKL